jgi:hypothetical protein
MPNPTIRTNADLTRAQAYEEELKREIAKTKGFGTNYTAYEAQLKIVRADIEKFRATNRVATLPPEKRDELPMTPKTPGDKAADLVSSLASAPLGLIQSGLTVVQNAAGFLTGFAQFQKNAVQAAREKQRRNQGTNSAKQSVTPGQPGNQTPQNGAPSNNIPAQGIPDQPQPSGITNPAAPGGTNSRGFEIQTPGATNGPLANAGSSPTGAGDPAAAASQTEALQSVGARLQAALAQNAAITNSLFQQTLELINTQNQKLGDVDRKISELTNQIKSLKNP